MIRLVMGFVIDGNQRIDFERGFGKPFDEDQVPARRIWGDLDETFMAMIFPELVGICKAAPFDSLPDRSHIMVVIDLFQRHVKDDPKKPVPIALTFGVHALLMSIYVLQGQGDLARLADYSKKSYNTLFEQMKTTVDRSKAPENSPDFYEYVVMYASLEAYAKSHYSVKAGGYQAAADHEKAVMLAFWNPLIAGEYMLYATFICSIGLVPSTVDSLGQLKLALHLYNGLKVCNPAFDVPLLEYLDKLFRTTKAVWMGGKPDKGSCYKVFWMSFGMSAHRAARLTASEHVGNKDVLLEEKPR
jgi:hypothetical protein